MNPPQPTAMPWRAYINDNLMGSGEVSHAAIFGIVGDQLEQWACSRDFHITTAEQNAILDGYKEKHLFGNGLSLAGKNYVPMLIEVENHILLKTDGSRAIIYWTNQTIIIGVYERGMGDVRVQQLGDYLKSLGY